MGRLGFLIFFLISQYISGAQKVMKGVEAYQDLNYKKSSDIFYKALERDSNNIVAQIGLCKSYIDDYEKNKMVQSASIYKLCFRYLKSASDHFSYCDADMKKTLSEKLSVFSAKDISSLYFPLSNMLWSEYVFRENNTDSIQVYLDNYCYGDGLKTTVLARLASLYYEKAQRENTIESYESFIVRFPQSPESERAKKMIEILEISSALNNSSAISLERVLRKYPESERIVEVKTRLATVYFRKINSQSDNVTIEETIQSLKLLQVEVADKYIDSCNGFLFSNEYEKISSSRDLSAARNFLVKYSDFKYREEYEKVGQIKSNILFSRLIDQGRSVNYDELHEFISEINPANYPGLDILMNKVVTDINERCLIQMRDAIIYFVSNNSNLPETEQPKLVRLLHGHLPAAIKIDTTSLLNSIKAAGEKNTSVDLIQSLDLRRQISDLGISFKSNGANWGVVLIRKKNASGNIITTSYFNSEKAGSYIPAPELKVNAPIFSALKRKYDISYFTQLEIIEITEGNAEISAFGYLPKDKPCCPGYKMVIEYERSESGWVPRSLKSAEVFSGSFSDAGGEYYSFSEILF